MVPKINMASRRLAFLAVLGLLFLAGPSSRAWAQTVSLTPSSINFGGVVLGFSVAKTVTVKNIGTSPLAVTSVATSGDYSQTNNCIGSIGVNASCTVTVTFSPTALEARPGSLSITDNAGNSPQKLGLSGSGEAPVIFTPTKLTFSNQVTGTTSSAMTLTFTNTEPATLMMGGVSVSSDFEQSNDCPTTLASNESCTISVTFTPATTGLQSGTLTVTDGASTSPQTVTMTGTGLAPPTVQLSPTSLSFPPQPDNTTSPVQAVTFTNKGSAALSISNVAASGDFGQSNNCGSTLSARASCTINVTFAPRQTGTRTGMLTLTDNGQGSPQTVSLTGVGSGDVAVSPRQISLTFGQTVQFQVTFSAGLSGPLNWEVDGMPGGNPSVGTISSSGSYIAPPAIGQHTIQVSLANDSGESATAQVYVTNLSSGGFYTQRYDNSRVGVNTQETVLTADNVNQNQFGKLFALPVDGQVYGQPLYMQNVTIPGAGVHNVVFVVTENDSVYAFDADGQSAAPLWQANFLNPALGVTTVPYTDVGNNNITPVIGITSTPVIDPASGTIYVTANTKEVVNPPCTSNCAYNNIYRLHALDITTGAEKFGGPVLISASVPGTGYDNVNGTVTFQALRQLQRPGLLLLNGVIYLGFGSHGDVDPYHGWLMAYDATSLQQLAVLNITPNGNRGSIWQGGGGIGVDAEGNLYVVTANGTFDANMGGNDYGDSVLKLQLQSGQFQILDYFTPSNQSAMAYEDLDLGSDPPLILPDQTGPYPHLLITAGKDARLWVLNRDNLGHLQPGDAGKVQVLQLNGMFFAGGSYWNDYLYYQSTIINLKQFGLQNGKASAETVSALPAGWPPSPPVVSANGDATGVLWAVLSTAFSSGGAAVLYAFNPTNVAIEYYNSTQAPNSRDQAGPAVQFVVPTVANGKVYVGTGGEVDVYGLLP